MKNIGSLPPQVATQFIIEGGAAITLDLDRLHRHAVEAMHKAYAPYSKFLVGAAILSENKQIYLGCNVENAAYPQGQCAEATAIGQMIVGGGTQILAIVVVGRGDLLCTPCGGCRQRIREFVRPDSLIFVGNEVSILQQFTLPELLPYSFGPENL